MRDDSHLLNASNYAFNAISTPAGRSTIEFVYEPTSLRAGAWLGVLSALLGLGALARRAKATSSGA